MRRRGSPLVAARRRAGRLPAEVLATPASLPKLFRKRPQVHPGAAVYDDTEARGHERPGTVVVLHPEAPYHAHRPADRV